MLSVMIAVSGGEFIDFSYFFVACWLTLPSWMSCLLFLMVIWHYWWLLFLSRWRRLGYKGRNIGTYMTQLRVLNLLSVSVSFGNRKRFFDRLTSCNKVFRKLVLDWALLCWVWQNLFLLFVLSLFVFRFSVSSLIIIFFCCIAISEFCNFSI